VNTTRFEELLNDCEVVIRRVQRMCQIGGTDVDDMRQEVAMALLELADGHTRSYVLTHALWALDWVRRERCTQGHVEVRHHAELVRTIDAGHYLRVWC
jgi:hypothetical protein